MKLTYLLISLLLTAPAIAGDDGPNGPQPMQSSDGLEAFHLKGKLAALRLEQQRMLERIAQLRPGVVEPAALSSAPIAPVVVQPIWSSRLTQLSGITVALLLCLAASQLSAVLLFWRLRFRT